MMQTIIISIWKVVAMMFRSKLIILFLLTFGFQSARANYILMPMDEAQANHLKAYGIAFWILKNEVEVEWLLNYRGGSFMVKHMKKIEEECIIRGVSFEMITSSKANSIREEIADPEVNMEVVKLEKAPKVGVYAPRTNQPWDDAVTLVLTYAEIPYDQFYDSAIVTGLLPKYDWLHLHHEDFTGQYGKFYAQYRSAAWYQQQQRESEAMARHLGFSKVSQMKLGVALKIKEYVASGGFLFTMCSGTDSYDLSLAAQNTDICGPMFDGDGIDQSAQSKLDFDETFAFENFKVNLDPMQYEFSNIDGTNAHSGVTEKTDMFTLFDFSAKYDVVPTMLCQNHTQIIQGFMGQTTDFDKKLVKSNVLIMGESKNLGTARYIHGTMGNGTWTFYGGHDPEDYRHYVGDPPTDLKLHPNSPGYRLILNNVLFPAAKKKKQKT